MPELDCCKTCGISIEALDRRIDQRLKDLEKRVWQQFSADSIAITKAEDSQRTYNQLHNDLQRKMEAQSKEMFTRTESNREIENLTDKMQALYKSLADRSDVHAISIQRVENLSGTLVSRDTYGLLIDRVAKLERWPWLGAGFLALILTIMGLLMKFLK